MARSLATLVLFLLTSVLAQAAAIDYRLTFTGTGNVGPGQFTFDSVGVKNVVLDPPVSFPSFSVWVAGISFVPMSPQDDALRIGPNGLVSALNADVNPPPQSPLNPEYLQLTEDLRYQLFGATGASIGAGTSSIAAVPEPEFLPYAGITLLSLVFGKSAWRPRKTTTHTECNG